MVLGSVLALIVSLNAQTERDSPRVEILGEKLPHQEVHAVNVSPNGRYLASSLGVGGGRAPILLISKAGGEEFREVSLVDVKDSSSTPLENERCLVDDDGSVLLNFSIGSTRPVKLKRALRFTTQGIQGIPVAWDSPEFENFVAGGLSRDGVVVGHYQGSLLGDTAIRKKSAIAVWSDGRLKLVTPTPLNEMTIISNHDAVAYTSKGIVGARQITAPETGGERVVPVIYSLDGQISYLALPAGFSNAILKAATPDASVLVGRASESSDVVPTVWVNGRPTTYRLSSKDHQKLPGELHSVAADGSVAVGTSYRSKGGKPDNIPVVWRRDGGLKTLAEFAEEKKIKLPEGWSFHSVSAVDPDGKYLFCTLKNKSKYRPGRLWLVTPQDAK